MGVAAAGLAVAGTVAATGAATAGAGAATAAAIGAAGTVAAAGVGAASQAGLFGGGGAGGTVGRPPAYSGAASKEYKRLAGKAEKAFDQISPYTGQDAVMAQQVSNVHYNPNQGAYDLAGAMPTLNGIAWQDTLERQRMRNQMFPGATRRMTKAGGLIDSYLAGEVPQDVVNQINRSVAERGGGTYDPYAASKAFQRVEGDFARTLGLTSLDLTQLGLNQNANYQQLANSFVTSPLDVVPAALGFAGQRYQYDALNTGINVGNADRSLRADTFNEQLEFDAYRAFQDNSLRAGQGYMGIGGGSFELGDRQYVADSNAAQYGAQVNQAKQASGAQISNYIAGGAESLASIYGAYNTPTTVPNTNYRGEQQYLSNTVPKATPVY